MLILRQLMFVIFVCERSAALMVEREVGGWATPLRNLFPASSRTGDTPSETGFSPYKARKREGKVASQPSRRVPSYVPTTRVTKPQQNPKNSPRFPVNI
ncbi:hypothetical protein CEXT_561931 [Caerostris extrusa]|uniref:Secreted protein n=1 Tax=Caerostris extrusa TaxID=172846 RepID=A0AAV4NKJ8_CAEEX|nr:hypothetical protein CEXT_561931 [Caerostris extrusa]